MTVVTKREDYELGKMVARAKNWLWKINKKHGGYAT